jgi:hypothetical protein
MGSDMCEEADDCVSSSSFPQIDEPHFLTIVGESCLARNVFNLLYPCLTRNITLNSPVPKFENRIECQLSLRSSVCGLSAYMCAYNRSVHGC